MPRIGATHQNRKNKIKGRFEKLFQTTKPRSPLPPLDDIAIKKKKTVGNRGGRATRY